jgi:hypothetical protein
LKEEEEGSVEEEEEELEDEDESEDGEEEEESYPPLLESVRVPEQQVPFTGNDGDSVKVPVVVPVPEETKASTMMSNWKALT